MDTASHLPKDPASNGFRAVLWDMDGTLIDSEPLWEIATYEMSEAMGRRITPELRERTVGGSFLNTATICAEHAGITLNDELLQHYRRTMFARVQDLLITRGKFVPGVEQLLRKLQEAGVPNAVVTNTPRELAMPVLEHLGTQYFSVFMCGDDVPQGKPDPMIYERAAAALGVAPGECLAVEDSTTGMTAAVGAGCLVLASPLATQIRPDGVQDFPQGSYCGVEVGDLEDVWNNCQREEF
ncbi:HAD family phosphatase [Corynebacterium sp. 35RC1]|nr:HAD family phosphatase [Corynebacterium sp. 35RC1]